MRVALALLAVVAGGIAAGFALAGSSTSTKKTIVFFERFADGKGAELKVAAKSKAEYPPGDYVVFESNLLDKKGGTKIGRRVAQCLHAFTYDMCRGTDVLTNRGSLQWEGLASLSDDAHIRPFSVTGGTGEFAGASGTVVSENASDNAPGLVWTVTLAR